MTVPLLCTHGQTVRLAGKETMMKRSKTTALLLMGTAPLLLTACSEEESVREGLYTSVETYIEQTNDRYNCEQAFTSATRLAEAEGPRYASREECIAAHGADNCNEMRTSTGHSYFMPFMTGFLMAQLMRGGQPAGLASSPAYRSPNGTWQRPASAGGVYRAGMNGTTAMAPVNARPNAAPTVSRGGFGASSAGRGGSSSGG